jgi:hypothetical protein
MLYKIMIRAIHSIPNSTIYQITGGSNKEPKKQNRHQVIYFMKRVTYNNVSNSNKSMNSMRITMGPLINRKILPEELSNLFMVILEIR